MDEIDLRDGQDHRVHSVHSVHLRKQALIPSLLALGLLGHEAVAQGTSESPYCVPGPQARRILVEYETMLNRCGRQAECWENERALLESAIHDHLDDPHLHRAYQDLFKRWAPSDREIEIRDLEPWYRELSEASPTNPVYLYAWGRWVDDPKLARSIFERAVEADPDFPWGHVGLAYVAAMDGETQDPEKLRTHIGRFIELCPSRSKVALSYAPQIDDAGFWRRYLPPLRAALDREPIAGTYVHYAQIWQLELTYLPSGEHGSVHQRIAGDLERIATLELWDQPAWTATLEGGYLLIGDDVEAARVRERKSW